MDGNGRWATERGLQRIEGHKQGAASVRDVVEETRSLGIRYLTLYAFSTENWQRPKQEVTALMGLFLQYLESELPLFLENDIRLRAIGDLSQLPIDVQQKLGGTLAKTAHCESLDLLLALSYGGRAEIVQAAIALARDVERGIISADEIREEDIAARLYAPDVPYPDLLIRTSNEQRISNFLLWQLAYSEIVITPTLWPDFSKQEYRDCLNIYSRRERRFGKTTPYVESASIRASS